MEPAMQTSITFALGVGDAQLRHDLVGVVLIPSPLLFGVEEIRCWATVGIGIQKFPTVDAQLAWLDVCMRPPYALHHILVSRIRTKSTFNSIPFTFSAVETQQRGSSDVALS